jgi:hypothetical protein
VLSATGNSSGSAGLRARSAARFCIYAILRLDGHDRGEDRNVDTKKKRLTLDLDPPLQRRLKAVAALRGTSMRQYCQAAIEKELAKDEVQGMMGLPFGQEALDRLEARKSEVFEGRTLPGDSAELIREARASRAATQ